MTTSVQRIKSYLFLAVIFTVLGLVFIKGCEMFPESTFHLSSDSRPPKWITVPQGLTRADVSLEMSYYSMPWGRSAQFVLRDKNQRVLLKENGKLKCRYPFELENPPQGFPPSYPSYEAISVNGVTEIIEHRKMEPIFYVTDDPVIRKLIESASCSSGPMRLKN